MNTKEEQRFFLLPKLAKMYDNMINLAYKRDMTEDQIQMELKLYEQEYNKIRVQVGAERI